MGTDLVPRAQQGDGDAFEKLIRAAYDGLYATAYRILRERDAAEDARWSPDGSRITFSSNADSAATSGANVWIVNADGSNLEQVTDQSGRGLAYFPDWSPTGDHLVVVYHPSGQRLPALAVMTNTGEIVCQLVTSADGAYPGDPDWGD